MNKFTQLSILALLVCTSFVGASSAQANETVGPTAPEGCTHEGHQTHRSLAFDPSMLSPNADFPYLTIKAGESWGFTKPGELDRLANSRRLMEIALNSEAFKQKVLAHTWNGKPQFLWNQGKTNQEIYDSIRQAQEYGYDQAPYVAEFNNQLKSMGGGTVGSAGAGNPWISTNTAFFRYDSKFTDAEFAGHIAHEWMHLLNYSHGKRSPHAGTVPYEIGDMIAEIAAQITGQ